LPTFDITAEALFASIGPMNNRI